MIVETILIARAIKTILQKVFLYPQLSGLGYSVRPQSVLTIFGIAAIKTAEKKTNAIAGKQTVSNFRNILFSQRYMPYAEAAAITTANLSHFTTISVFVSVRSSLTASFSPVISASIRVPHRYSCGSFHYILPQQLISVKTGSLFCIQNHPTRQCHT